MYLFGGIICIGVVLVVPLTISLSQKEYDGGNNKTDLENDSWATTSIPNMTTISPSMYPTVSLLLEQLPNSTVTAIFNDPESPQAKAYEWMVGDPMLDTYLPWRLVQRFILATIYFATNGSEWTYSTNWLSYEIHECDWLSRGGLGFELLPDQEALVDAIWNFTDAGRTGGRSAFAKWEESIFDIDRSQVCNSEDEYISLFLYKLNLQGVMPPEFYLMTSLKSLDLSYNINLGGKFLSSEIGLMTNLEFFWLGMNSFSGSIFPKEISLLTKLQIFRVMRGGR